MIRFYNKLVRDRMPGIIIAHGNNPLIRTIDDDEEYLYWLRQKLKEEVDEYLKTPNLEELADIEEVMNAIKDQVNQTQLFLIGKKKRDERGGFSERKFMAYAEIYNPGAVND